MLLERAQLSLGRISFLKKGDPFLFFEVEKVQVIKFLCYLINTTEDNHVAFKDITGMTASF